VSRSRKILRSIVVLAIVAACVGAGTYAAFSGTTANAGSGFTAGTVAIGDNDGGVAAVFPTMAGGDNVTGCLAVTYTGSLDAGVRLYASLSGTLGPYITLIVTRGTDPAPAFGSCTGFTADATNYLGLGPGVLYNGLLSAFPTTYATGIVDPLSASPETWTTGESHSYRFSFTLANDNQAQGKSQNTSIIWEARNL
jgi:Camelysin metallo-endopeptidase